MPKPDCRENNIVIVGSGFSGLGMAIRLKQAGIHDFAVLERAGDVGGTWQANTYPGCACDVPSHLYSFSFAPNPDWSETYSRQPEIWDYLQRCADDFGVRPHVRLDCEVRSTTWLDDERVWALDTSQGPHRAKVLIAGLGYLAEPRIPDLPGLDTFEGPVFHSARWDHGAELASRRVASIGTGASAIQYVPAIQPEVERLYVFQRTPPWVVPHTARPISQLEHRLFRRVPATQRLVRGGIYASREALVLGFAKEPRLMKVAERVARRHMERQLADPALREKATPHYTMGCKRILPSNRWYAALAQPNVELVTDGVAQVRPRSIVDAAGVEREVDAIVFGTGFRATDHPAAQSIRGRGGRLLADRWNGSPRAHLGTTVAGFPNLFFLLGPNTGLGHSSMVYMVESQVAHVLRALELMHEQGADTIEVRPEALERYNAALDRRLDRSVWNTGCASWYLDANGRNAALWPDWTWRFRRRVARLDPAEYAVRTAS
ncbi:MAG TPA: NAD(P)/FAD-dependent oxidoreductase [Solirubrobacteraceae bacterium]|jgi:cation diffusion facilitator CzcD-associated flavoprotein CzcO|nr:NAD(P)/FAD-dependent oxidoreductase [Solirubrobacteraceae bacterium]